MTYEEYISKIKELTLSADKAGFAFFSIDYANDSSSSHLRKLFLGKKGYYGRYEVLDYYTSWLNANSNLSIEFLDYAQTVLYLEKVALEIVVFTLEHFFSEKELETI